MFAKAYLADAGEKLGILDGAAPFAGAGHEYRDGLVRLDVHVNGAAYRFIVLAGVVVGGVETDGFVVALLPLELFLRRSRSHEDQGTQEYECKCRFHSKDNIQAKEK